MVLTDIAFLNMSAHLGISFFLLKGALAGNFFFVYSSEKAPTSSL